MVPGTTEETQKGEPLANVNLHPARVKTLIRPATRRFLRRFRLGVLPKLIARLLPLAPSSQPINAWAWASSMGVFGCLEASPT